MPKFIMTRAIHPTMQNEELDQHEQLLNDKSEDWKGTRDHNPWTKKKSGRLRKMCAIILGLVTVSLAVVGFVNLSQPFYQKLSKTHTNNQRSCSCGSTLDEAKAQGCTFDTLALDWLPLHCQDKELGLAFAKTGTEPDGSWKYWADKNKTREYTLEEIAELPGTDNNCFFVEPLWHKFHCTYYWRKLYRSRFTGTVVESESDSVGHLAHCEMLLLDKDSKPGLDIAAVGLGGIGQRIVGACEEVRAEQEVSRSILGI